MAAQPNAMFRQIVIRARYRVAFNMAKLSLLAWLVVIGISLKAILEMPDEMGK